MELTLRPIGERDLPALSALYEQLVPGGTGPDNMKKALRQLDGDCLLLGAFWGEKLVGSACGFCCPDLTGSCRPFLAIENVVVGEDARGLGAGRLLIEGLEAFARSRDCGYMMLVSSAWRTGAHAFYRKLGFDDPVAGFRKLL